MAVQTKCQTPDAVFSISIENNMVDCLVTLPFDLELTEEQAELLESNLHNAVEGVLARYF